MKIKIPTGGGPEEEVQMAPMIDMVFLLLIFFMVASHLNQMDRVNIRIPVAKHAAVPEDLSDRRTISITAADPARNLPETIYVGTTPRKLEEIELIIKNDLQRNPNIKVYLRADRGVKHKAVQDVMKVCASAGVLDIIFATLQTEGSRQ